MSQDGVAIKSGGTVGTRRLEVLDQYQVHFVALDLESDRELVSLLRAQPGWIVDCKDSASVLFARAGEAQGMAW